MLRMPVEDMNTSTCCPVEGEQQYLHLEKFGFALNGNNNPGQNGKRTTLFELETGLIPRENVNAGREGIPIRKQLTTASA